MMEERSLYPEDILLCDQDFPANYINMHHKDDYKIHNKPIKNFFIHKSPANTHYRLIARISWKINSNTYIPMSFICDTGAPKHLYLSNDAITCLTDNSLIKIDDLGDPILKLHSSKETSFLSRFEETPKIHQNANIIGLRVLIKLGLCLKTDIFSFNENFEYL
jgi:hypothetical protein